MPSHESDKTKTFKKMNYLNVIYKDSFICIYTKIKKNNFKMILKYLFAK